MALLKCTDAWSLRGETFVHSMYALIVLRFCQQQPGQHCKTLRATPTAEGYTAEIQAFDDALPVQERADRGPLRGILAYSVIAPATNLRNRPDHCENR